MGYPDDDETRAYRQQALGLAYGNYRLHWWRNVLIGTVAVISAANLVINIVQLAMM